MNLDELQSVQSRERQTDSLQQLRASFYEDAAEFVHTLREERDRAAAKADDPFDSPDVNRLSDDIRTAEQTVEAIYERRVGKVVKMASLAAADMSTEQEGLTKEEQALFETMVEAIEDHRGTIIDVLGGDAPAGAVSSPPPDDQSPREAAAGTAPDDEDAVDAASVMGDGSPDPETAAGDPDSPTADSASEPTAPTPAVEPGDDSTPTSASADESTPDDGDAPDSAAERETVPAPETSPGESNDDVENKTDVGGEASTDTARITVRITEDVGEIFGVDEREYDLATDDVVTLPTTNAEPLIDRDAAEPLE